MKHTKQIDIMATIGSATEPIDIIIKMIKKGFNVARLSVSHSNHTTKIIQIKTIKQAEKKTGKKVQLLVDLSGPKIRVGEMEKDTMLIKNSKVIITTKNIVGNNKTFSINYSGLPKDVNPGDELLIADGKRKLKVLSTNKKDEIVCKVVCGGLVTSRRGMNAPKTNLTIPVITAKDKKDIIFAIENKVDMIALSFVRDAKDINDCRKLLGKASAKIKIIAKIETRDAMKNLERIIEVSDGAMVARGDLAIEIGYENVPLAQKEIIRLCNEKGKYSIVATQLLDSMEKNPVPTRAEVSDIATALLDGTDALMLSGETAIGQFPAETVEVCKTMIKTIL